MPRDAIESDGTIDLQRVPRFVRAVDQAGEVVGYVDAQTLLGIDDEDPMPSADEYDPLSRQQWQPVFDSSLERVVGHIEKNTGARSEMRTMSCLPSVA